MANTRSAAKQARASERRRLHNRMIKSKLHTLEKKFLEFVAQKKLAEATEALRQAFSALDKAAKVRVIPKNTANRKKSRLSARLKMLCQTATA
ncbi:MAG: 30S ribosomal protein S20 [Verrucomicrobiae bacterium]|nr:30S ribosomal protein S20 [Verrucomicrobiae bacterium]